MLVDMHCHVIHGVDDGARNFDETKYMLQLAADQGVKCIVATSHSTPGYKHFPAQRYLENLQMAQEWCDAEEIPMKILQGTEILYTDMAAESLAAGKLPTLGGGDHVLVEFNPRTVTGDVLTTAAQEFRAAGVTPVFAHIERYRPLTGHGGIGRITELKDRYGVVMQVNASTIFHAGVLQAGWTRKILDRELVDIVSSDAHNVTSRPCCMAKAYDYLMEHYGWEYAEQLCGENACRLLGIG